MELTPKEAQFLTVLLREQNQTGCKGPAHDFLRKHAYPNVPLTGRGSLAFSYELVHLTSFLLDDFPDLEQIDSFLRTDITPLEPKWPWASADEFRTRLEEARKEHERRRQASGRKSAARPALTDPTILGAVIPHK